MGSIALLFKGTRPVSILKVSGVPREGLFAVRSEEKNPGEGCDGGINSKVNTRRVFQSLFPIARVTSQWVESEKGPYVCSDHIIYQIPPVMGPPSAPSDIYMTREIPPYT